MNDEIELSRGLKQATSAGVRVAALRLSSYAVGFVASVLIARALGPQGRGLYAYPLALLGIAFAISHMGLEYAQVHLTGKGENPRPLWANAGAFSLAIGFMVWIAVAAALALDPGLFGSPSAAWVLVPLGLLPLLLMNLYWTNLLQLRGRLVAATRAAWIGVALQCLAVAILVLLGQLTPFRVLLLQWITNGLTWLLLVRQSKRAGIVSLRVDASVFRRALTFGLKSHVGQVSFFLVLQLDQILVRIYAGYRPLGLYALAVTLAGLLWLLTDPLAAALLPYQVDAVEGRDRQLAYRMARLSLTISFVAAVIAWTVAPFAIRVVYGSEFAGSVWAFRLLLPGVVALTVARPLGAVLIKEGRPLMLSGFGLLALFVNVALNVALIPKIGIEGASISSSICYVALAVAYIGATRRRGLVAWSDLRPRWSDVAIVASALASRKLGGLQGGPLRVVLVVGTLRRGGTEGQVVNLATGLRRRGCDVSIICLGEDGGLGMEARNAGVQVHEAHFHGFGKGEIWAGFRALRDIRRRLKMAHPHVVQCFLYWSYMIVVPIARSLGVPAVISGRRSLTAVSGSRKSLRIWERLTDTWADAVVCNSEAVLTDAQKHGGVPQDKLVFIANGVSLPEQIEPVDPRGYVLTVANFTAIKGHRYLFEAFARVRGSPDLDWLRLRLAGQGSERETLRLLAERLGIEAAIDWLGVTTDVRDQFRGCLFSVLPSLSEGMPNAVIESLANGRAVVAFSVGGTAEILQQGGGILVPAGNVAALASAMISLARNPVQAADLGREGRTLVESRYSLDRMIAETFSLYVDLLTAKGVATSEFEPQAGVRR
jgi:glycosyltransferase involved in cell wall biosynthesis/O-antigen/teichoic acid export membrane protein